MAGPIFPHDDNRNSIPVLRQNGSNTTLKISPSGSHTESSAITATVIRIAVTANMNIEIQAAGGSNVAVATTSLYMPANTVEYFSFPSGGLVSAIGTGDVYITPMA